MNVENRESGWLAGKAAASRLLPYLALAAILIAFANGAWFFAETRSIGGDALNGYAADGHYFVSSHGDYTEVSEATWQFSRLHALTFIVTFLLGFGSMAYLSRLIDWTSRGRPGHGRAGFGRFALPTLDAAPPGIMLGLYGLGILVGIAFLLDGIFYVAPNEGTFGGVWTVVVGVILIVNGIRIYFAIRRSRK